jgi:galactokinase
VISNPSDARFDEQVRRAAAAFEDRTARRPDGVWAAPGRVNLIGEHTDYNEGFVLPFAIDRHAVVAIGLRHDRRLRLWSLQDETAFDVAADDVGPGMPSGWGAYPAGVFWALGRAGVEVPGFDVVVDGSVPIGSGLSSSAALESAVALGLAELAGVAPDRVELALAAQRAEVEAVGMPCGVMDQMASMLCRAGHALFLDTRDLSFEHIPLAAPGLTILIVDTRVRRRLTDGRYAERRAECEAAAEILRVPTLRDASLDDVDAAREALGPVRSRRARHVVRENGRVLAVAAAARAGRWDDVGPVLTASHVSLRDDFQVSSPELDAVVDAALAAGALGARMTGAGFGGSALVLTRASMVEVVVREVEAGFAARGFERPTTGEVRPVEGARRAR